MNTEQSVFHLYFMLYLLKEGFTETQSLHLSLFFLIQHIKAINILQINTRPPACLQSIKSVQTV